MIEKLRFRFIKIACLSVLTVLISIIATVNIVHLVQNNRSADDITRIIFENGGVLKKLGPRENQEPPTGPHIRTPDSEFDNRFHNREELPFSSRYFSVFFDREMQITGYNIDHIVSVSEDELNTVTSDLLASAKNVGWYKNYRYRLGAYGDGYLLVVLEATATKHSVLAVFSITVAVGAIAFFVVFLLIWLFSQKAVAPIARTYEKQKQFITDASHELKTPLTVISANTEILSLTYGENEWCDGIQRQTESMRALIGQMIQMAKLDEDRQQLVFETFDFSDAVYDTAMAFVPMAEKKGLKMNVNVAAGISMYGDEGAIRQVIAILTDNAVKYCDVDGIISVDTYKEKNHIIVSLKNSFLSSAGPDTEKIFERFYREDRSRTTSHSYGLGLSIAKSIVEKHKGKIWGSQADGIFEMRIRF